MNIPALILLPLILLPIVASAVSGSWSGRSTGGVVSVGGQTLVSQPLTPLLPSNAHLSQIAWRIELLSAPPPGLRVKLCGRHKCILLDSLSGRKSVDGELTTQGPFYFIYSVESKGQLLPPLNVVDNHLTIIYR